MSSGGNIHQRAQRALNNPGLRRAIPVATDRLRIGRKRSAGQRPDFEALRERGRAIRTRTVANLQDHLHELTRQVEARGGKVHFAPSAAEAVDYITRLAVDRQVGTVVKSKSMVTEELHLNGALEEQGMEVVETDLGEYIVQLAGETPSHIIAPALHKSKADIAALFSGVAGEALPSDTPALTAFARARLREAFLRADMGVTGCNFALAESGAVVLVTNEGNGRMVTALPRIQVTVMGMERVVPTLQELDPLLHLLPLSATGQKATSYMTVLRGPRRELDVDGPEEFHLVIVDNGRSELVGSEYQEALNCIRCGACLNVCPVYRHIGGHAYGHVYSGPIGAVLTPLYRGLPEWGEVAGASSLCGACWEVCPVKIPLHDMLIDLRRDTVQQVGSPRGERLAFRLWRTVMRRPTLYRLGGRLLYWLQRPLLRRGWMSRGPYPLSEWTRSRDFPALAPRSFRDRWPALAAAAPAEAAGRGHGGQSGDHGKASDRESAATRKSGLPQPDGTQGDASPASPAAAATADMAVLADRFVAEWEAVGGEVVRVQAGEDLGACLAAVCRGLDARQVVRTVDPRLDALSWQGFARAGVAVTTVASRSQRDVAAAAQVGITWADYAIAETGTIVEEAVPGRARVVSLLPPVHVVVIPVQMVRETRTEVFASITQSWGTALPGALTLITGPSRTADIENELSVGVHGPGRTVAVLVS